MPAIPLRRTAPNRPQSAAAPPAACRAGAAVAAAGAGRAVLEVRSADAGRRGRERMLRGNRHRLHGCDDGRRHADRGRPGRAGGHDLAAPVARRPNLRAGGRGAGGRHGAATAGGCVPRRTGRGAELPAALGGCVPHPGGANRAHQAARPRTSAARNLSLADTPQKPGMVLRAPRRSLTFPDPTTSNRGPSRLGGMDMPSGGCGPHARA